MKKDKIRALYIFLILFLVLPFISSQEIQEPPADYSGITSGIIILLLFVIGIFLLIKSRKINSKILTWGILLPLIWIAIGILWYFGNLIDFVDFGTYLLFSILLWPIIMVISLVLSIISLIKIQENKKLAIVSIVIDIIYLTVWLIYFVIIMSSENALM